MLNSDLVKTLTGGDPIKARFLRQNSFVYIPSFKIVINTNYLPKIFDDTVFESDRLVLLSFDVHFDENSRDNSLKRIFSEPENISGIFNWCYEGYKKLEHLKTFKIPDKSKALFEKYRDESDIAKQFISEILISVEGARLKFKTVYDEYKEWARDNGYKQWSRKTFREKIEKHLKVDRYVGQDYIFDYDLPKNNPFI